MPSTPSEFESVAITFWVSINRARQGAAEDRRNLVYIGDFMKSKNLEQIDLDILMAWIRTEQIKKGNKEAENGLNQVIYVSFSSDLAFIMKISARIHCFILFLTYPLGQS